MRLSSNRSQRAVNRTRVDFTVFCKTVHIHVVDFIAGTNEPDPHQKILSLKPSDLFGKERFFMTPHSRLGWQNTMVVFVNSLFLLPLLQDLTGTYLLDILVENMGRSNILPVMDTQRKGLANTECYLLFFSIFTFRDHPRNFVCR